MLFKKLKYLNYIYFSEAFNIKFIPEKNIYFALIKVMGKSLFFSYTIMKSLFVNARCFTARQRLIFFVMSSNNFFSVNPVHLLMKKDASRMFGDKVYNKEITLFIPTFISAFLAPFFFPLLLYDYYNSSPSERSRFRQGINDIILSYPFYYVSYFWMRITQPKGIIISNDHVYSSRTLVYWANKLSYPSFYIQHASVTEKFPKLEMTYAFLEGEDAKQKYIRAGSDPSKIELIGIAKLDYIFEKQNMSREIKVIGIASNSLEIRSEVLNLILSLCVQYPDMKFIYRPHRFQYSEDKFKADLNHTLQNLPPSVIVSNPFNEQVTDYLSKLDCLVAGESGIHLEAVLLNVTSIYYFRNKDFFDDYGFVKNGLVDLARDFNELCDIINRERIGRRSVRHRAKMYCSTIDTEYDGRSAELAVSLLNEKLCKLSNNI